MWNIGITFALFISVWTVGVYCAAAQSTRADVELLDDCDPADFNLVPPPGGGCALKDGDVTRAEFNAELLSPLADAIIGHLAWRNEPTCLKIALGDTVRVKNEGGRNHTFTQVADFGGGRVPALNSGLDPGPECQLAPGAVDPTLLPPDASLQVNGLDVGNHCFQCCLHPWRRTLIKVLLADVHTWASVSVGLQH